MASVAQAALSPRRGVAHDGADGPGERFEIAIHRVVIGGVASLALAAVEVVAIAVHAVDELTQHAGVDPALGVCAAPETTPAARPSTPSASSICW